MFAGAPDTRTTGLESRRKRFLPRILSRLPREVLLSHFPDEETEVQVNLPLSRVGQCFPQHGRQGRNKDSSRAAPDLRRLHHHCLPGIEKMTTWSRG